MSPATVNGKCTGVEGDLWAMGVVLYQCITGEQRVLCHWCSASLVFRENVVFCEFGVL